MTVVADRKSMKPKVYLETSVISYVAALPSRDILVAAHQLITHQWWDRRDRFSIYVSQAVLVEASGGDPAASARRLALLEGFQVLDVNTDAESVAATLMSAGVLPPKASVDALHAATAAVHGIEYLVTWNCAHLANAACRARLEESCRTLGLQPPIICTPEELML